MMESHQGTSLTRVYIIVASINPLENLRSFFNERNEYSENTYDVRILVIDEGYQTLRKHNSKILSGLSDVSYAFYGPKEREYWFKSHFNTGYDQYLSVIPEKCHAETSFGFLVAYENEASIVIEVDDDVLAVSDHDLLEVHRRNLIESHGIRVNANNKWYNSLENLSLNSKKKEFPRGHPYDSECRDENYEWIEKGGKCVLNMGLWSGAPDFDALTILYHGGLNGMCKIKGKNINREKIIIGEGTYFAICSMNTGFLSKIIPAFYQLYMNHMGIDRYDDIWSGLFLKKVADHLGDNVCLGAPLVYHDKRPRDTFEDLKKEIEGMIINERLWQVVDELSINGNNYTDAYLSLTENLQKHLSKIGLNAYHERFMKTQITKMRKWTEITDKLR